MPRLRMRVATLVTTLSDNLVLAEPLFFPEISCCQRSTGSLPAMLRRRLRESLRDLPAGEVYRRRLGALPRRARVDVSLPPIHDQYDRTTPVELSFSYVRWRHGDDASVAFVPALGIEVLASSEKQLDEQLVPQILAELGRRNASRSLRELVHLERHAALVVRALTTTITVPTVKQAAQTAWREKQAPASVLKEVATDLRTRPPTPFYEREPLLKSLVELLAGASPRSVLLVGPSGAGKSSLVEALAGKAVAWPLGNPPLWTTSGSRIVAGQCGYGMWQERCQGLVREAARTRAIVHLGNLIELCETGKGGGSTTGVAAMLRPAIADGRLRTIVECTPEQLAIVERETPQLLEAFTVLDVAPTTAEQTRVILRRVADEFVTEGSQSITPAALAELDRLHRRFATYSAPPGRAVRFLRNLLDDRTIDGSTASPAGPRTWDVADVVAAFSRETGLPLHMLDDSQPLDLHATRDWFAARVIGQEQPVALVTDLLAAVKASLVRAGKPIASLLFIGPTGVGKTELAKALAEFLYQDPGRMIRFDMSEFSTPAAVARLVGGLDGAPGRLTQEVRDQPFMVVLLDEFEKAHPLAFDMLLQVLGEGRLTDSAGRVADFTNAVVIMTSNLGVESFRPAGLGFGGASAEVSATQHFERTVREFLRPELFNRIDRIVPFAPLGRDTIERVARRELDRLRRRDGLRLREIRLDISDAAVAAVAEDGYVPKYGARPLKRTIEQRIVAPLADRICRYEHTMDLHCQIDVKDGQWDFAVTATPTQRALDHGNANGDRLVQVVHDIVALRRNSQRLRASAAIVRMRNEVERLRRAEADREKALRRRQKRRRKPSTHEVASPYMYNDALAKIQAQEKLLAEIAAVSAEIHTLEDLAVEALYSNTPINVAELADTRAALDQVCHECMVSALQATAGKQSVLTLAMFGESFEPVIALADAYARLAKKENAQINYYWLARHDPAVREQTEQKRTVAQGASRGPIFRLLHRPASSTDRPVPVIDVYAAENTAGEIPRGAVGLALVMIDGAAGLLLSGEAGRHEFTSTDGQTQSCFVETISRILIDYQPPADVGRATSFQDLATRRTYSFVEETCVDVRWSREYSMREGLPDGVERAVRDHFQRHLWERLEEC